MDLTPLDDEQRRDLEGLVTRRRLEPVPADIAKAERFLEKARRRLADVDNLTWDENRYNLAYDAAHDVGEALLAAYGFRTLNGPGQHEAVGRFLRAVLTTPPGLAGARRFDQMRRARNSQRYQGIDVGTADADLAVRAARALYDGAFSRGLGRRR